METMKQGFVQDAGLADSWYCQAEKEMFGFVIRDKQTNIFSATQEASIPWMGFNRGSIFMEAYAEVWGNPPVKYEET